MNHTLISDQILNYWKTSQRVKMSAAGWLSGNAPCCVHNGETRDTRGRGGFKTESNGSIFWHCFNCGFVTGYIPGHYISLKLKKLLSWIGVTDSDIRRLVLENIRLKNIINVDHYSQQNNDIFEKIEFETKSLPSGSKNLLDLLSNNQNNTTIINATEYLFNRKVDLNKYQFYWNTKATNESKDRIIIPFTYKNKIVGYAEHANFPSKVKYINHHQNGYVFNMDNQLANKKVVIVTEGVFDAMSLDCVAVLGNDINNTQAELISRLNKDIIVVPHWDHPGRKLIQNSIDYNWNVSFPIWSETCKDINEAVIKYGKLFVLKTIIDSVETNPVKIKLKAKGLR